MFSIPNQYGRRYTRWLWVLSNLVISALSIESPLPQTKYSVLHNIHVGQHNIYTLYYIIYYILNVYVHVYLYVVYTIINSSLVSHLTENVVVHSFSNAVI